MLEDEATVNKPADPQPRKLETLSVDELRFYLDWLDEEKTRVEVEIDRKESFLRSAEQAFANKSD